MDCIQINRSELVGLSRSNTAAVEALVRANALNLTGTINYNESGVNDGVGFEKVTKKFVDNFILRVLVPDYNVKKGKNIFIGSQNKKIREILDSYKLEKCIVKAIAFTKLIGIDPPEDMLESMPDRNINKTADFYYYQDFKIACPNIDYSLVMDFARNADYNGIGFFIKDLDITTDYAGSFDKCEIIDHLTINEGFREEGNTNYKEDCLRTIINNDTTVGMNCLSFMENIDRFTSKR